jgi:hypothetical protein
MGGLPTSLIRYKLMRVRMEELVVQKRVVEDILVEELLVEGMSDKRKEEQSLHKLEEQVSVAPLL